MHTYSCKEFSYIYFYSEFKIGNGEDIGGREDFLTDRFTIALGVIGGGMYELIDEFSFFMFYFA